VLFFLLVIQSIFFYFLINFIMHSFIRKSLISICQSSFGLSMIYEDRDRLLLQWIPILHKCSYKQCCIARAAKFSIKPLSKIVTSIFSAVKMGLQKYHDSCCYRSCVNQMWILKNSKDLLYTLSSRSQYVCNRIM
jgi:hypothetical protein